MAYLWSDAWLLQAIALASRRAPASLAEVLAAADGCNHALPTRNELHGALVRLTGGGYVAESDERFMLTERVPRDVITTIAENGWKIGRTAAETLLGSEAWTQQTSVTDPRNHVTYPGLTEERMRQADREFRRRIRGRLR